MVVLILWTIPRVANMAEFYGYFLNSVIVTVGTLVVSISIGCLAGYGLARFTRILEVLSSWWRRSASEHCPGWRSCCPTISWAR